MGGGGELAKVIFLTKNPDLKKKKDSFFFFCFGGGGWGEGRARLSDFFK